MFLVETVETGLFLGTHASTPSWKAAHPDGRVLGVWRSGMVSGQELLPRSGFVQQIAPADALKRTAELGVMSQEKE